MRCTQTGVSETARAHEVAARLYAKPKTHIHYMTQCHPAKPVLLVRVDQRGVAHKLLLSEKWIGHIDQILTKPSARARPANPNDTYIGNIRIKKQDLGQIVKPHCFKALVPTARHS